MSDRKTLIERIEYFYIEIVEEFKEAEQQIINDSQFRSLFRRKHYDDNIQLLKDCKQKVLGINTMDIKPDPGDEETKAVAKEFGRALSAFRELCDAYVQLQVFLKKKAQKEEARLSVYKGIFNKVKQCKEDANKALHSLDILYTDYTEQDES